MHPNLLLVILVLCGSTAIAADPVAAPSSTMAGGPIEFIDTSFENASPIWYERMEDGAYSIHLLYDHERSSPNRAAGHFHFRIQARPGASITLEFTNLDNVWNGRHGSVANELKAAALSSDGQNWKRVAMDSLPGNRVRLTVQMEGEQLYVAREEPYRISDLEKLLNTLRTNSIVQITNIGKTVQGRDLEMIRVGKPRAPYRVFLRARAHPWEAGGNWVVEGLIHRLLAGDAEARKYLERYCVYILPMANKDGVANGRTRFNMYGTDLNRNWDKPADPKICPENDALEKWLEQMIAKGQAPHLAIELHNDGNGLLHISRPRVPELPRYLRRMEFLETLLRRHTWFTEGSTKGSFRNSGTLGDGWLERYHIDAIVHEFNCNWIAGLNDFATASRWQDYGANLGTVLYEYFGAFEEK